MIDEPVIVNVRDYQLQYFHHIKTFMIFYIILQIDQSKKNQNFILNLEQFTIHWLLIRVIESKFYVWYFLVQMKVSNSIKATLDNDSHSLPLFRCVIQFFFERARLKDFPENRYLMMIAEVNICSSIVSRCVWIKKNHTQHNIFERLFHFVTKAVYYQKRLN